jgi:hypothetical protein
MAKTQLVLFIEVDEAALPKGSPYTELPDQLYTTIYDTLPSGALQMTGVYMANPKQDAEKAVRNRALNYHHYAVNIRGEACEEEECEQHPVKNVISFHDHKHRNNPPPGVN